MPVTLKDIAEHAGYSITTVSRALTGYDDVKPSTRQHILQIAEQLGYHPNDIARQLQKQRTYTLGLVMPPRMHATEDDYFSVLLRGIIHAAARSNYDVLASAADPESNEIDVYRRVAGGKRVDGMILARPHRDDPRIAYLQQINFPFIVHGRRLPGLLNDFNFIDADSETGLKHLTEHFIALGHTHIGLILPPDDLAITAYRLAGYRAAMDAHAVPFRDDYCTHADLTYAGGREAAAALIDQHPQLTAIIGCNDWMALGAMEAARQRSLPIGEQFAVAGYDDIPAASYADPKLTTVRPSIYTSGERLTAELIRLINDGPTAEFTQLLIQPELIVRESSGHSRR